MEDKKLGNTFFNYLSNILKIEIKLNKLYIIKYFNY